MSVWTFIQDQVLGMKWLNQLIGTGLSALGLDVEGCVGGSVQFFLYDVVKITILLCVLIFVISYIQSYFPPERSKKILGRFHGVGANVVAAQLGTVLAFMMAVTTLSLPSLILLRKAVKAALLELHMDEAVDHVTDFAQIASYGVMTTPALVVDGRVVSYGKVLKKDEAKALIGKVRG